jgi:hypothetical protein
MEINELDEKLIPDYLIDENNFLEDEIIRTKTELKQNDKKIESILNFKTIQWNGIKSIRASVSYTNVATLIADARVDQPNSIFYFYNFVGEVLTMVNVIKCSELPDYKDNFELYEFVCNKIKTMLDDSNGSSLYYIKGFISNKEFNVDTSNITLVGSLQDLLKIKIVD